MGTMFLVSCTVEMESVDGRSEGLKYPQRSFGVGQEESLSHEVRQS